jgi:hypothetical protein
MLTTSAELEISILLDPFTCIESTGSLGIGTFRRLQVYCYQGCPRLIWADTDVRFQLRSTRPTLFLPTQIPFFTLNMASAVSFYGPNSAAQIGINQGKVTLQFHTLANPLDTWAMTVSEIC